jgi:predicted dithiol-disulfide oxidoreductase (DUF899 family)
VNTATREQWMVERTALLEREKQLTRLSDELARQRAALPRVRIDVPYVFDTEGGPKTLAELFDGRSQLLVYHFMHGPGSPGGCSGCTYAADSYDASLPHLNAHDVTLVLASRSPLETLLAYRERMGWTIPWVSCGDSTFNRDFGAFTEAEREAGTGFNFGTPAGAAIDLRRDELMGLSAFELVEGVVYHTYSTFDRGTDVLISTWQLLDRAPRGREDDRFPNFPRRKDEYTSGGT